MDSFLSQQMMKPNVGCDTERERETERDSERQRETERDRERQRDREREGYRYIKRERKTVETGGDCEK